jgi:hypothetical protein
VAHLATPLIGSVPSVTPQRRGTVPPAHVAAVRAALQAKDDAQLALELAVAAALKAGGSIRELERATGLSTSTIQKYGRAHGWPTPAQQAAFEEFRTRSARFEAQLRGEVTE